MGVSDTVKQRVIEPAVLRFFQWRGDPVARLMQPALKLNPYPLYEELRERGLVHSPLGAWMTASHATVNHVLLDRRFSSSPVHQKGYKSTHPSGENSHAEPPTGDLLTMDPPDHTRIRRLVTGAFSPRAVASLEPWIREKTSQLLSTTDAEGFDLIDTVALPLPIAVICHLLGVPSDDEASFRLWGHDVASTLEPQTSRGAAAQARTSERALTAYLRDLVTKRRADPDDSLLAALIAVEEEGDRLSLDELVSTALLLLVAGFETTVNLIGNGTVALLGEPEQWRRLHEDPALLPTAIEELLRYDSPVQVTSRTATEDIELNGATLARGESIIVAIGGANRDPEVFDQPDQLQIDRTNANRHLSFSLGIHHCLGAALARLEGRIVVEELTRQFPTLKLTATPIRRPLMVLRGFERVPVRSGSIRR